MSDTPWRHERYAVKCCKGCVPPKRYPGCGDHCKEYKEEKAQYKADIKREKEFKKNHPAISSYDFERVRSTGSRKR